MSVSLLKLDGHCIHFTSYRCKKCLSSVKRVTSNYTVIDLFIDWASSSGQQFNIKHRNNCNIQAESSPQLNIYSLQMWRVLLSEAEENWICVCKACWENSVSIHQIDWGFVGFNCVNILPLYCWCGKGVHQLVLRVWTVKM